MLLILAGTFSRKVGFDRALWTGEVEKLFRPPFGEKNKAAFLEGALLGED